jgi:hypothetical protein
MKAKKPNAELVWKQLEDLLAPRLRLSVIDRTVYAHLLRHTRLEGKLRLRFSILGLGRNIRLSPGPVREAVRRLVAQGALRIVQRSKLGHVVEVRLPGEIRAARLNRIESRSAAREQGTRARAAVNLEETDFLRNMTLRKAIHARERGQCFYCCAAPRPRCSAWTTLCRRRGWGAIPTGIWSPAAWNATRRKGKSRPMIFSAASTASAA